MLVPEVNAASQIHRSTSSDSQGEAASNETCSICLETICLETITSLDLSGHEVVNTRCNHLFHERCLEDYFKKRAEDNLGRPCPLCRQEVITKIGEAVSKGRFEEVEKLIASGANLEVQYTYGNVYFGSTLLNDAAMLGHTKILEALINAGLNVNLQDAEGKTALYAAVEEQKIETICFLLANGANPNLKNQYGFTPLHWAVRLGNVEIVKVLVDAGADVNAMRGTQGTGNTPLYDAVIENAYDGQEEINLTEIVKVLVAHGADLTWKNCIGKTCFEKALSMEKYNRAWHLFTPLLFPKTLGAVVVTAIGISLLATYLQSRST